jgi:hypothetical protein
MRHRPHPAGLVDLLSSASEIPLEYPAIETAARSAREVDVVEDDDLGSQDEEIPELDSAE